MLLPGENFPLANIHPFSVRRPSIRPPVNICANRFFSQTNDCIAIKLAQNGS